MSFQLNLHLESSLFLLTFYLNLNHAFPYHFLSTLQPLCGNLRNLKLVPLKRKCLSSHHFVFCAIFELRFVYMHVIFINFNEKNFLPQGKRYFFLHSINAVQTSVREDQHISKAAVCDSADLNGNSSGSNQAQDGPLREYQQRILSGELNVDAQQQSVVEKLQTLHEQLKTYTPSGKDQGSSWFKVNFLSLKDLI